ncbi:hypothetical protein [Aquimarina aggregata]|uniref:hypothetical protein n=1 Tax=Aquimarina aggregata TaxID=1642818 RepID=UPI002493A34F|nr:hypothetical protein [Aquimarina aggregata]
MNEEEKLRQLLKKSTINTSDDFINNLMHTIEDKHSAKSPSIWWSFKTVFIACTALVLILTFILFKLIHIENGFLGSISNIPKMPIFLIITTVFLYYINTLVKLSTRKTVLNK